MAGESPIGGRNVVRGFNHGGDGVDGEPLYPPCGGLPPFVNPLDTVELSRSMVRLLILRIAKVEGYFKKHCLLKTFNHFEIKNLVHYTIHNRQHIIFQKNLNVTNIS